MGGGGALLRPSGPQHRRGPAAHRSADPRPLLPPDSPEEIQQGVPSADPRPPHRQDAPGRGLRGRPQRGDVRPDGSPCHRPGRLARRRANVNGVADLTTFICSPVETADIAPDSFDIVWADAILHHVLDDLDLVLCHLARWTRPSGLLMFAEPVNLANALR